MIRLNLVNCDFKYELENIIQLFYPQQSVSLTEGDFLHITAKVRGEELSVHIKFDGNSFFRDERCHDARQHERLLCALLFELLSDITGLRPRWGIQTGVRPVKLLRAQIERYGEQRAERFFKRDMLVDDEKYALARSVYEVQRPIIQKIAERSFSLYISIPFCRSRCSYCSFISHDVERSQKLMPDYIDRLCEELRCTANIARELGLVLQTIYIGGGTPTAVSEEQLAQITDAVARSFDMSGVLEYTIEAGRPDTVTREKLRIIKAAGAERISINPQTLSDEVLRRIRRGHTVADFYNAYNMALAEGFSNINTDLIAGLPGDSEPGFEYTLDGIAKLSPACVTVHTLSIKRSSRLVYTGTAQYDTPGEGVSNMLGSSVSLLSSLGYRPYYMYRQSRMAGNNENIGWSRPGSEGLYNVFIMEELQSILAVGAGASTKLVRGDEIQRIFNYKYPYEYISGFDEMLRRKQTIFEFYAK